MFLRQIMNKITLLVIFCGALAFSASAQTTVIKSLYLSDPSQALDRIDPVASADATTATTVNLSSAATDVVIDATSTNFSANPGSATFTVTHATGTGSNRLMLVGISQKNKTVSSVTYGGTALTLVGEILTNGNARMHLYSLLNPTSGTANVVITLNANPDKGIAVGVTTFTNVDQTTPLGTFAGTENKTTMPTVAVTSATGELVYDVVSLRNTTMTVGSGQTQLYNIDTGGEIQGGGASTKPGAASVTMSWTAAGSQDWAIGAVSIKPAAGITNTTFTQGTTLCSALTIKSGQTITVTNYVTVVSGTMPASPSITALLKYGATTIISLSAPTYNSGTGLLTWTGTLGADVTVPAGEAIALQVTTAQSGVVFNINYDSQTKPSKINLPVSTYIDVSSYAVYSAAYPGGSILTNVVQGATVYPRAVVTDPFGFSDITAANITITPPSTTVAATSVATSGCTRTYEYAWNTTGLLGTYSIPITANEGLEGTVTDVQTLSFDVIPTDVTLMLAKTGNKTTVLAGQNIIYTLTLTNSGATTATNVQVKDKLPAGVNFVSATPSAGTFNSTTGVWTVPSLATGSQTLAITVTAQ